MDSDSFPLPQDDDAEDVAWGLTTGEVLWRQGEHVDAIVWLRRAAGAALDAGHLIRSDELNRTASALMSALEAGYFDAPAPPRRSTPPVLPPSQEAWGMQPRWVSDPDVDFDDKAFGDEQEIDVEPISRPPVSSRARPGLPPARMPDPSVPFPLSRAPEHPRPLGSRGPSPVPLAGGPHGSPRSRATPAGPRQLPPTPPARAGRTGPHPVPLRALSHPPPAPVPVMQPPSPPPGLRRPRSGGSRRPAGPDPSASAHSRPLSQRPPPLSQHPAPLSQHPAPSSQHPRPLSQRPPPLSQPPELISEHPPPPSEPPERVSRRPAASSQRPAPSSERPAPSSRRPSAGPSSAPPDDGPLPFSIAGAKAFDDLAPRTQSRLIRAAHIEHLDADEEVALTGLAYVVTGTAAVEATVVDTPIARLREKQAIYAQGTSTDSISLRLLATTGGTTIATWDTQTVEELFDVCPEALDRLKEGADRFQVLAAASMGPLGERLDEALLVVATEGLEVRRFEAGAVLAQQGEPVPGIFVIGLGSVELTRDADAAEKLASGDLLFATEILSGGAAPATAVAGPKGVFVLFGNRQVAHELVVSCPPLLEIFAGM